MREKQKPITLFLSSTHTAQDSNRRRAPPAQPELQHTNACKTNSMEKGGD